MKKEGRYARHGKVNSRAYKSWYAMKDRCNNESHMYYKHYGGRGIGYDPRWEDFTSFYADVGDPPDGHTLDRPDTNADYGPDNWRWATGQQQQRNKRNNRKIRLNHRELTLIEWCEMLGFKPPMLCMRLKRGWSVREALTTPPGARRKAAHGL